MRLSWALLLLALVVVVPVPVGANDFVVFPVKVKLPIHVVVDGTPSDRIVKETLKEKDLVNLALGRSLKTKVDKQTEVLAVVVARYEEAHELSSLVVFDPSQNGLAQITATVGLPTAFDYERAYLSNGRQGQGTVVGEVQETALGEPSMYALHSSTIWVSGSGKSKENADGKTSVKGIVAGRVSLTTTENGQTATREGFIVKGKAKVSGKIIGLVSDGIEAPFCGDGIVQPQLGEECEFNNLNGCLGTCGLCKCRYCGNDRRDPGEICDGPDNEICDMQSTPVPCREDCAGCASCGDGTVSPHEECDIANDVACPGLCLYPECQCGCAIDDPEGCPGSLCCHSDRRCHSVKTGYSSDDPDSPLVASFCQTGGFPVGGLCGDLIPPGSQCPDLDGDPTTGFYCHECNGKFVHKICVAGAESCVLDETGPLP